ncbi:nucleophile aminohydrolase [Syncephalis pseudoplumigaleata]|uniref:Proteasome subunit beta n=1 Tax=Syncephalis pseudoplumigaleata TaxID=1712513 RepID=A0A4P9YW66_9FUNG|nr:nucleophile aminohydrolase [Syncephalis pseudoplumigaleata]|eukprot:RKP24088.1 nucleophile aminohydrolase [Syncephalis pseudoplumigaleata]
MEYATQHRATEQAIQHRFDPYADNGGTILAIAGEDFCVVAGDTRQSEGYSINSRYAPKVFKMKNNVVLANSGFHADGVTLTKRLNQRIEWYRHAHEKDMSAPAFAQMLATTLYGRRFFPYYSFCIVGRGMVYGYDPVGSYERYQCRAAGSAQNLVQPFLDSQITLNGQKDAQPTPLSLADVLCIVKDAFTSATERDIYTGDYIELHIITREGVETQLHPLKKD